MRSGSAPKACSLRRRDRDVDVRPHVENDVALPIILSYRAEMRMSIVADTYNNLADQ
jgi:hypothetical protein